MDYSKLKEDNGFYLYKTDAFVSNVGEFYFIVENSKKNAFIISILSEMLDEKNKVLGDRQSINEKARWLYGLNVGINKTKLGGKLAFSFNFKYLDKDVIKDDYHDDVYSFISNYLKEVDFDENSLSMAKKRVITKIKEKMLSANYYKQSLMIENSLEDSMSNLFYFTDVEDAIKVIDSITLDDVKDFYESSLTDDCFFRGYAIGRYDDEEYKKLRSYFPYKTKMGDIDFSDKEFDKSEDVEIASDGYNESSLFQCYKYNGDNKAFVYILYDILNYCEVLREVLRDKYGLVYGSYFSYFYYNKLLFILASIDKNNKEKTIEAINEVMEILHDEEKVKEYLDFIYKKAEEELIDSSEDCSILANYITDYIMHIGNTYDANKYLEIIKSYTPEAFIKELDETVEPRRVFFHRGDK